VAPASRRQWCDEVDPLIESDPENRAGRQVNVRAIGGRDGPSSTHEDAEQRPPSPPENAAKNGANRGAGADSPRILSELAVNGFGDRRAQAVGAVLDSQFVEGERQASPPVDTPGRTDGADKSSHEGTGRYDNRPVHTVVNDRRCLESLLDLGCSGVE
jgi:hypothetical protein